MILRFSNANRHTTCSFAISVTSTKLRAFFLKASDEDSTEFFRLGNRLSEMKAKIDQLMGELERMKAPS